jgi:hypothetical protein
MTFVWINTPMTTSLSQSISIRPFADSDSQAVRSVAQRDSSMVPAGELLVAAVDGEVRAVLSLDTGEVVADPFAPSNALVDLLRTRARQLTGGSAPRRRRRGLLDRRPTASAARSPVSA